MFCVHINEYLQRDFQIEHKDQAVISARKIVIESGHYSGLAEEIRRHVPKWRDAMLLLKKCKNPPNWYTVEIL